MAQLMINGHNLSSGYITDEELNSTSINPVQNKVITEELNKKINTSDLADWAKAENKPEYTASDVGADPVGSASTAKTEANTYTDESIAALINGAPTTLDTLKEIADAMAENENVVDALETAIGTKANANEHNIKTYRTIQSLGLTTPTTVAEIFAATPIGSIVHIGCEGTSAITDLPVNTGSGGYGILEINKEAAGRFSIVYKVSLQGGAALNYMYIGQCAADGSNFSWDRVLTDGDTLDADTLDGLHSNEFITGSTFTQLTSSINDCYTSGTYSVEQQYTPDFPQGYGNYGLLDVRRYSSIVYQTIRYENGVIINRAAVIGQTNWTEWARVNDGGNAATVNGLTVQTAVPANAKFTDTVYTHPTSAGNKHIPSGGASGQILRYSASGTAVWSNENNTTYSNMTAATASAAGKAGLVPAPAAGKQASFLRGDGTWVVPTNTTYGAASTTANGLMTTGAQTFAGAKTFNGVVDCNGASAVGTAQARNIYAGTADMTAGTSKLETGAIYIVYE